MHRELFLIVIFSVFALICGQRKGQFQDVSPEALRRGISTRMGNFSLELLYQTSKAVGDRANLIISPVTVWTVLAVIAEGSRDRTLSQIKEVARLPTDMQRLRNSYFNVAKYLTIDSDTVQLKNVNSFFINRGHRLENDYQEIVSNYYKTQLIQVDFANAPVTANLINDFVRRATNDRIKSIVQESSLTDAQMLLASALYFKGRWASPFNSTSTEVKPFYDAKNKRIGDVKMMYNRDAYPFASIRELQANVIEIPYSAQNRLSMLVMLPHENVTLENMFSNFITSSLTFDRVFKELKISQEEYSDFTVDCYLPRFKIESDLFLNTVLMNMGIYDMFDIHSARLSKMARTALYVSRVIHKAEIEVTEEGTTASAVTAAEISNRIEAVRFEVNRPFAYMIVEKTTNSLLFGGIYQQPSIY